MRKILVSGFALLTLVGAAATLSPAGAQEVGGTPFSNSAGSYGYDSRGKGMEYGKGKTSEEYGKSDRYHRDDYSKRYDNGDRYSKDRDCQYNCGSKYSDNHGSYGKGYSDRDGSYNKYNNKYGNSGYENGNRAPIRIRPL
jgi:hypothetical protein